MAGYLRAALLSFLTEHCFDEYFVKFNFLDGPCLKSSISKGLGVAIIAGSVMVKIPQILKIMNNRSGKGINVLAVNFELIAITSTISYSYIKGFPFSAWGDGIFLAIQTTAVAALVLYYSGNKSGACVYVIAYSGLLFLLMSGITPVNILWSLQASNIPVVFCGKMIQARTNYQNGSTGQLSAITCFMLLFGSVARIFTSIQETGDFIMVLTYCIASSVNLIIVMQLFWYWNADKDPKEQKEQKATGGKKHKRTKKD